MSYKSVCLDARITIATCFASEFLGCDLCRSQRSQQCDLLLLAIHKTNPGAVCFVDVHEKREIKAYIQNSSQVQY